VLLALLACAWVLGVTRLHRYWDEKIRRGWSCGKTAPRPRRWDTVTHSLQFAVPLSISTATFYFRSHIACCAALLMPEDMLQETFIRWQQSAEQDVRSPSRVPGHNYQPPLHQPSSIGRVQREEYVGEWLPEPIMTGPGSDPFGIIRVDESLSMAFLVLLERLTRSSVRSFLLREVFEYEYSEIASFVGQSEVNCRQILRRARQACHRSETTL